MIQIWTIVIFREKVSTLYLVLRLHGGAMQMFVITLTNKEETPPYNICSKTIKRWTNNNNNINIIQVLLKGLLI